MAPITLSPLVLGVMLPSAAFGERAKAQEPCDKLQEDLHDGSPPFLLHRFAMFNKVRIPHQNLLDRSGNVTSEGTYNTPFKVPVGCGYLQTELLTCLLQWRLRPPQEQLPWGYHTALLVRFGAFSREGI